MNERMVAAAAADPLEVVGMYEYVLSMPVKSSHTRGARSDQLSGLSFSTLTKIVYSFHLSMLGQGAYLGKCLCVNVRRDETG